MTSTDFLIYFGGGLIGFLFVVFIVRWAFGINRIIHRQHAILRALLELCEKQGVSKDTIDSIRTDGNISPML